MIITVINQKGGVGKTTLVFHLCQAGVAAGKRVLVLDMDTQSNASQFLTGDLEIKKVTEGGVGDLFEGKPIRPLDTQHEGIFLLHGHEELDRYDNDAAITDYVMSGEIRAKLRELPFDLIIVDTPPATGLRHLGPLCWSDLALVPMEPAMTSIVGFQEVLETVGIAQSINPSLRWKGIINRFNKSARSHLQAEEEVRKLYGDSIVATLSSRTSVADALQELPAQPVWAYKRAPTDVKNLWRNTCFALVN